MNIRTLLSKAALLIATLGAIHTASATEYRFIGTNSSEETRLCVVAASNHLHKLKSTISSSTLSPHQQVNGIRCNGASLAQFAYQHGADKTYRYLASYSSAKNRAIESVTIRDLSASVTHTGGKRAFSSGSFKP